MRVIVNSFSGPVRRHRWQPICFGDVLRPRVIRGVEVHGTQTGLGALPVNEPLVDLLISRAARQHACGIHDFRRLRLAIRTCAGIALPLRACDRTGTTLLRAGRLMAAGAGIGYPLGVTATDASGPRT